MTDRYIYHRDEFENDCIFSSRKIFTKPGPKTAQPAGSQLCHRSSAGANRSVGMLPERNRFPHYCQIAELLSNQAEFGTRFFPDLPQDCLKKYFQP